MNQAFDACAVDLEWTDLPVIQCPEGIVHTGSAEVADVPFARLGVWEHPVGVSTDHEQDEVFVVLSGRGRVLFDDGTELELYPGVVATLDNGSATTWIVDETLRKVWLTAR